jgi:hypothetical protein
MRVGFRVLQGLISSYGVRDGFRRYNGSGPAAEAYAADMMARLGAWRARLSGAGAPSAPAPSGTPGALRQGDTGPAVAKLQEFLNANYPAVLQDRRGPAALRPADRRRGARVPAPLRRDRPGRRRHDHRSAHLGQAAGGGLPPVKDGALRAVCALAGTLALGGGWLLGWVTDTGLRPPPACQGCSAAPSWPARPAPLRRRRSAPPVRPLPTAPDNHPGPHDQRAASDHRSSTGDDGATFHRPALGHADGRADRDRDICPPVVAPHRVTAGGPSLRSA